eukprot:5247831-Alexandrium_andersonii.AAC.1
MPTLRVPGLSFAQVCPRVLLRVALRRLLPSWPGPGMSSMWVLPGPARGALRLFVAGIVGVACHACV